MSFTGTLGISSATGRSGADALLTLTLTNTDATAKNVLSLQPTKSSVAAPNHNQVPVLLGTAPVGQGMNTTVSAGGTLVLTWNAVGYGLKADSPTFYLGCIVRYTDGVTTADLIPTPVTYQVTSDPNFE